MVDWFNKEEVLKELVKLEVKFVGNKKVGLASIILTLKAKKLIRKGYTTYLARVMDNLTIRKELESVPIVCEHFDVFPKEINGLPPRREIKFY